MRPITLCTGQWADLPLAELVAMSQTIGFDGLELACWGDHFEVQRALAEEDYCCNLRQLLTDHQLEVHSISNHLAGQAVLISGFLGKGTHETFNVQIT